MQNAYRNFQEHFRVFASKHPRIVINTLSNIFTMRLIGNKTHGDMAEVGMAEFVNQFMYDFRSEHVGKAMFRKKEHEEDIVVTDEISHERIPVSLKAYGDGPLQLSTDKSAQLFASLRRCGEDITDEGEIRRVFRSDSFRALHTTNVLPLIYREEERQCNIMVYDFDKMEAETRRILYVPARMGYDADTGELVEARIRVHPVYLLLNAAGGYECEVRYGGKAANALQRGLWTHTQHAASYFNSLTNGWISYSQSDTLVRLFRLALNASERGHEEACKALETDIESIRKIW